MINRLNSTVRARLKRDRSGAAGAAGSLGTLTFFLLDNVSGFVNRFDPETMTGEVIASVPSSTSSMIGFDQANQKVVLLRRSDGVGDTGFFTIDPDGENITQLEWTDDDDTIIAGEFGQMVILADPGPYLLWCNDNSRIRRADWPSGANQDTRSTVNTYRDMDSHLSEGFLYVAAQTSGIRKIPFEGTGASIIFDPGTVYRIRIDPDEGYIFYAETSTTPDAVKRADLDGGNQTTLFPLPNTSNVYQILEIDRINQRIYAIGGISPNKLYEYDYDGNELRTSAYSIGNCRSITRGYVT